VVEGRSLDAGAAHAVMRSILAGEATAAQIGALAVALRMKGETVEEVTGLARAMREAATSLPLPAAFARAELVDTCGTGGDGAHTVNLSTAVAFVAAGAGARVAKHGNRAVSSRAGSADVLEALGVRPDLSPEASARSLEEVGIAFLFAPAFHGALRHAAAPRREMGIRTVFNVLGPLCNPAGAGRQLVGVFDAAWVPRLARVLGELGARRACVVHSEDGLDEISLGAPTRIAWLEEGGGVREEAVSPETFGLGRHPVAELRGGDAAHNAAVLRRVLEGEPGAALATVLANAAAALRVAGLAADWEEGVARAREAVASGRAHRKLEALVRFVEREAITP
jgi:anthranilate phosphoribosyltransferase